MGIETLCVQPDSVFLSKSKKGHICAMGMDKRLQCLVGLTWWNLLQCTWVRGGWVASQLQACCNIFQDNLIGAKYFRPISSSRRRQIWEKFSEKSFPAAANLDEVLRCGGWCTLTLTLCSSKKGAVHCISHLHTANCTHVHYTLHLIPCLHLVHSGNRSLHTAHCTLHTASNTLGTHCVDCALP